MSTVHGYSTKSVSVSAVASPGCWGWGQVGSMGEAPVEGLGDPRS